MPSESSLSRSEGVPGGRSLSRGIFRAEDRSRKVYPLRKVFCVLPEEGVDFGRRLTNIKHPILPELRKRQFQYNAPVHIGRNC